MLSNLLSHPLWLFCNLFHLTICYNQPIYCYYYYLNSYLLDQLRIRKIKDFNLPSFIPFLTLFLFYVSLSFRPVSFSFPLKNFFFTFSAGRVYFHFPQFLFFWERFVSLSLLKGNFAGYRIWVDGFFFEHFKYFIPLSSCLHGFLTRSLMQFLCLFLYKAFLPTLSSLKLFSLSLSFCSWLEKAGVRAMPSPRWDKVLAVYFPVELWRRFKHISQ